MKAPNKNSKGKWIPPDKEWLEQIYLVERLGTPAIADLIGSSSSKRVWKWLKFYKIPIRPAGGIPQLPGNRSIGARRRWARQNLIATGQPVECRICKGTNYIDVHHVDEDTTNEALSNLIWLCRSCHRSIHRTGEDGRKLAKYISK